MLNCLVAAKDLKLSTPEDVLETLSSNGKLKMGHPVSWAGNEKDESAWLDNELQQGAIIALYQLGNKMNKIIDKRLLEKKN